MGVKMYRGDKPCIGCGKNGKERPRINKDGLCAICTKHLLLGQSLVNESNLDRQCFNLDDLALADLTWHVIPIAEIDQALRDLLRTFSQFDTRYIGYKYENSRQETFLVGRADCITSHDSFVLPTVTFQAAKELCKAIEHACWQLKRERDNYKKELDEQLRQLKNDIFNEGVEHGRDLLRQLNNGEITLADLNQRFEKY